MKTSLLLILLLKFRYTISIFINLCLQNLELHSTILSPAFKLLGYEFYLRILLGKKGTLSVKLDYL